jgi:hypothetical protein
MNRYTYRDIFSSHKVAGPAVSPLQAAEAEKTKKAAEAKKKLDSLADEIETLITAFEPLRTGSETEVTIGKAKKKIKDPADLSVEIDNRIKELKSNLTNNKTIIDSGAYNEIAGRLNNFNTGLATIQKTLKQIEDVEARVKKEKEAREAKATKAATAKK